MSITRKGRKPMGKINRALISVSDKQGIIDMATELKKYNVEILSTGGTAKALRDAGIAVKDVSEHTGFPEMLDGRIKTLHPKIHGGLLGKRSNPEHVSKMQEFGITPIDMVIVNLYPFEATVARTDCTLEEAIENIDIGGPTMLRSAAKNYMDVTVIVDPSDYSRIIAELGDSNGKISAETNLYLSKKVFQRTSNYDSAITQYLAKI
jgi:phosphoribosylaminoimidazolecarboxamide formyltransferase/IMP cyclohydrolase